jgi:hypothetical protein
MFFYIPSIRRGIIVIFLIHLRLLHVRKEKNIKKENVFNLKNEMKEVKSSFQSLTKGKMLLTGL